MPHEGKEDFTETGERKKFGFYRGARVKVIGEDIPFQSCHGATGTVLNFTATRVVVLIQGPSDDMGICFKPEDLQEF